jgi:LPS export ABC transporter permease LptG
MMEDIRKWRTLIPAHQDEIKKRVTEAVERLVKPADVATRARWLGKTDLPRRRMPEVDMIAAAINTNSRVLTRLNQEIRGIENQNRLIGKFLLEVHKKYSIPAACLVFVLIGGPLGIMARRGGIGVGLGMSLGLFVLYWAFLIGGEDLSDRGIVSPAVAMWSANFLIAAAGLVLLWRVTRDIPLPMPSIPRWLSAWWERRFSAEGRIRRRRSRARQKGAFCPPGFRRLSFYALKSFLFNLLWAQAAFWFIFIIIDLVERLDKYIDRGIEFVQVLNYYIYYTPYILVLTLPVAMLLATLFCVGVMGRRNELLALRASGVPIWRLGLPLGGIAMVIVALVVVAGELVLPWADQRREAWKREKLKGIVDRSGMLINNLYAQGHDGRLFYFETFEPKTGTGTDVLVETFRGGRLVAAEEMATLKYEDRQWIGRKGRSRIFAVSDTAAISSDYLPFINRVYHEWTEEPDDFIARRVSPENMGYRELYHYIKAKEEVGGDTTVERTDFQWKFSYPLINFVIVLFGLPIAVRVRQSGMALNFGIAMAITFVFRVLIEVFRSFGHNGDFSPEVSAWVPIGIFFVAGVFMLSRIRN